MGVVVAQQLASMDLLICSEVLYKDHQEDDLGLGGLRSLPDPALITDQRVLDNVLNGHNGSPQFDYFKTVQSQLKPHMRKIVADWMLEVTEEAKCSPEVFSLAVNYMDRVLSKIPIEKSQFQLLASVCIFLASKFKESSPLCAEKLVICSDFSFSTKDIMTWELMVLELLNWDLSAITPYCILDQLLRRLLQPLSNLQNTVNIQEVRNQAEAFLAVASTEADFITTPPSLMAVASLISAFSSLKRSPEEPFSHFVQTLLSITGVTPEDVSTIVLRFENLTQGCGPLSKREEEPMQISPFCSNINHKNNSMSRTPTEMVEISTCVF